MLLHINPTRQRGKRTGSLARASGWYMTFFAAGVIEKSEKHGIQAAFKVTKAEGGHPFSGVREAWLAPNVPLATVLTLHAPCRRPEIGFVFSCSIPPLFVLSHSLPMVNTMGKLALFWRFSLTASSLPSD